MSRTPLLGRTGILTAVCAIAIVSAGGLALAANLGILDAADDSPLGDLEAVVPAGETATTATTTATTPTTATAPSAPAAAGTQVFVVDEAGSVTIIPTATGIAVASLTPNTGWTATPDQAEPSRVHVTFTDGTTTLVFEAVGHPGDVVTAEITTAAPATAVADHEDGEGHGDDATEAEHEYEGWDDDD